MKKATLILFMLFSLTLSLYADDTVNLKPYENVVKDNFIPDSASGDFSLQYITSVNPAYLAKKRLIIELPQTTVTFYRVSSVFQDEEASEAVSRFTRFNFGNFKKDALSVLLSVLESNGSGFSHAASVDAGLGASMSGFGLSIDGKFDLHTMPAVTNRETGEMYDGNVTLSTLGVVPELNLQAMVGYGCRFYESKDGSFYIDTGVSLGLKMRLFTEQINANYIISSSGSGLDSGISSFAGWGLGLNAGVNAGFFNGLFEVGLSANNIKIGNLFGSYTLREFKDTKLKDIFKVLFSGNESDTQEKIIWSVPFDFNISALFKPDMKLFFLEVSFDFVNVIDYFAHDASKGFNQLFKHLNLRATVKILKELNIADIAVAFKYGYPEFGLGIGISGTRLEVSYGWKDSTSVYGERPVDYLNIRVKLGYDSLLSK